MGSSRTTLPTGYLPVGSPATWTAKEHGAAMAAANVKPPAPELNAQDISSLREDGASIYRVKDTSDAQALVVERGGYATVYMRPASSNYRDLYEGVTNQPILGRDVDHLSPRSTSGADYVALGSLTPNVNRSQGNNSDLLSLAAKATGANRQATTSDLFVGGSTYSQNGRAVVNGYLVPFSSVKKDLLEKI